MTVADRVAQQPPATSSEVSASRLLSRLFDSDRRSWQLKYGATVLALDVLVLLVCFGVAVALHLGNSSTPQGVPYPAAAAGVVLLWLSVLALSRCYETRFVLRQVHELLQIMRGTALAFSVVCLVSFVFRAEVSRALVCGVFPVGMIGLVSVRVVMHRLLRAARSHGLAKRRALLVGEGPALETLAGAFEAEPEHGHVVVAVVSPHECLAEDQFPGATIQQGLNSIRYCVLASGADTVAVAAGGSVDAQELRLISYSLEGLGVELLVAPSLADVAGSRVSVRPVAGLPLLHVDEPELDGVHKLVKGAFDRTAAALGLLLLLPVLVAVYAIIRVTSSGPGFFRHQRIGRDGEPFGVWKFRSMYSDAAARHDELMKQHAHEGPLFKLKNDPRVTPIGRFIRKWSIDELPQLINVLTGDMSLVGPRPQVQAEVDLYEGRAYRRLLVKPGITGLWQVSGRSDLEWEQAVRLDLRYVEGWSLGLDVAILGRTVSAVLRSSGAY